MSHFTVTVTLPPTDPREVAEAVTRALAPFDENKESEPRREYIEHADYEQALAFFIEHPEHKPAELDEKNVAAVLAEYKGVPVYEDAGDGTGPVLYYRMTTYNEQSKWDWWQIGGRWADHFIHRPDADLRRLVRGSRSWMNEKDPHKLGYCDGGPRGLLDFEAMREEAARKAAKEFDRWTDLTRDLPEALPWEHFTARVDAEGKDAYSIEQARKDYREQARVKAAAGDTEFRHWWEDVVAHFAAGRDALLEKARLEAVPGYALLRQDGTWDEPGRMGWFGMSEETDSSRAMFKGRTNAYLEELDPDAVIVNVDCHI
ncbi:hypothetical protein [Streptomyces sp. NPDC093261]|uniref:hypothetical protein n=1 Tax=Streptomyces sp. NPDC093261 TaxID=3366037 RepID=UPI0037F1829A